MPEEIKEYLYGVLLIIGFVLIFVFPPIMLLYLLIAGVMRRGDLGSGGKSQSDSKPVYELDIDDSDIDPLDIEQPRYHNRFMSAVDKDKHLTTAYWHNLKQERLIIADYACEVCGCTTNLHLHHVDYEHLGAESIDEVVILCGGPNHTDGCHQAVHDITGYDRKDMHPISVLTD